MATRVQSPNNELKKLSWKRLSFVDKNIKSHLYRSVFQLNYIILLMFQKQSILTAKVEEVMATLRRGSVNNSWKKQSIVSKSYTEAEIVGVLDGLGLDVFAWEVRIDS